MRKLAWLGLLMMGQVAVDAQLLPPTPGKVDVRFIVRVCEGQKFEPLTGEAAQAREKECMTPLSGVPLVLASGDTKTPPVSTDGTGVAIVGPLEIRPEDSLRVVMACTTHNCMTLRLNGVRSGDVKEGDNRLLVFTVPNAKGSHPGT